MYSELLLIVVRLGVYDWLQDEPHLNSLKLPGKGEQEIYIPAPPPSLPHIILEARQGQHWA